MYHIIKYFIGLLFLQFKNKTIIKIGFYLYATSFAPMFGLGAKQIKEYCYKIERINTCDCNKCYFWTCCDYHKDYIKK